MLELNIYKNQKEIEKTYKVDAYDLMYGTVEDIFDVLDGMENMQSDSDILKLVQQNRTKLNDLLLDVFGDEGLTQEELRKVKLKEMIPFFVSLFDYVKVSFASKN